MSIVLVKVYFKVYNDNERSKISIDSFVTRFLNRTSMCNCRTLSLTFLISCSIPKSFLVLLLINEKHAKALDVQTSETNSIRFFFFFSISILSSFPSFPALPRSRFISTKHFSFNHLYWAYVCVRYLSRLFDKHKHAFLFNNSRCWRQKKAKKKKKKLKNTAVSGIRARLRKKQKTMLCARVQFAIFSSFQLFSLRPSTDARFLFCICSLTANKRARRRSHPFSELVVAFYCNRNLFSSSSLILLLFFFVIFRLCSHITFLDHHYHHHHHRALLTLLSSVFFFPSLYTLYMFDYVKTTMCYNFKHASLACRLDDWSLSFIDTTTTCSGVFH